MAAGMLRMSSVERQRVFVIRRVCEGLLAQRVGAERPETADNAFAPAVGENAIEVRP